MTEDEFELLKIGASASEERKRRLERSPEREAELAAPRFVLSPRTRRCQRCRQIYEEKKPRTVAEIERLRQTLNITGPGCHVEQVFCDICYEQIVDTPNRRNNESSYDVGQSNVAPPNLLLQRTYSAR